MPRGRRKNRSHSKSNEIKPDPHEILHNLIQKARNLTDKDIWNHSLGGKIRNKHKIRATEKEEDEELIHEADLSNTKYVHLKCQPSLIRNGQLRDYQIDGVSWLINLRYAGLHGILADEMGLGKTIQCIALLAYLREKENINGIYLIIVPKSTIINWCREFKKWCPSFNVFALEAANKEERKQLIKENFKPKPSMDVIICSYEICMIEKNILRKINYEYIIVDEAHRLKNNASKFSTILREQFTSLHRLLVTGTPLQNNLRELWSLLNFLLPNLFKNAADFDAMFDFDNSDHEQEKIFKQLRILLKPFLLRRLKKNVDKDLPPKTELIIFVGMSELQKDVYKKLLLKEMNTIQSPNGSKKSLLNLVMQLRKCTNHPYLFDGVEDMSLDPFGQHLINNCGKLLLLDKLLFKLFNSGSRILIFSQMTRVLDILEDYCTIKKYIYCRIDGSTSGEDRQIAMDDYNSDGSDKFIFLLTTRAGGLGINLQSADIVIIYDSDWNPQMDLQAMDRAHRIGQTKPVFVYRLVTKDTVEQRILERAELKLRLDAMVIQKHKTSGNSNNNSNNLMEMIQYGADKIFNSKGSTVTDEDINAILNQSITDTEKLKNKWEEKTKKQFSELTLEFNYQQYDGCDYTEQRKERAKKINEERFKLLNIMNNEITDGNTGGIRSTRLYTKFRNGRNKNYNEDAYFRDKLNATTNMNHNMSIKDNINCLLIPNKLPDIRYWQLYDVKNLYKIYNKEWEFFNKHKNVDWYDGTIHIALSDDEIKLKKEILENGFNIINYRDFGCFIRLVIKYGKNDIDSICKSMIEIMDMELSDDKIIRKYHKIFFEKGNEIEELENAMLRIEEGEQKRINRIERKEKAEKRYKERMIRKEIYEKRRREAALKREKREKLMQERMREQEEKYKNNLIERILKWKNNILINDNIYKNIQIPDAKCADVGFNKDIDRFLFITTYKIGYGNWNEIYLKIINNSYFKFNFYLNTLKPCDLKYRMDTILRSCVQKGKNKGGGSKRSSKESSLNIVDCNNGQPPNKKRKIN